MPKTHLLKGSRRAGAVGGDAQGPPTETALFLLRLCGVAISLDWAPIKRAKWKGLERKSERNNISCLRRLTLQITCEQSGRREGKRKPSFHLNKSQFI